MINSLSASSTHDNNQPERLTTGLRQRHERAQDHVKVGISQLRKSRDCARFLVGEAALADPGVWAKIEPLLEVRLATLGKRRQHVTNYHNTVQALAELRALLA